MRNGYFKILDAPEGANGTCIKIFPPVDGGQDVVLADIINYLGTHNISYDLPSLKAAYLERADKEYIISSDKCPVIDETYTFSISEDKMTAVAKFFPPSSKGKRISMAEFLNDLRYKNVVSGVQMQALQDHFMSEDFYCTDIEVAIGKQPVHGEDDRIEYYFNIEPHIKPTLREDGSVDYYNLNTINHCKKGDILARIIRGDDGTPGTNVLGQRINPRTVKKLRMRATANTVLSEDMLELSAKVDGHVTYADGQVFVSDVYIVENVDMSTGNIEYSGSVQINGNVNSGFIVKAGGNVVINGVVEGAQIIAEKDIVIARGMNGMSRGMLKAGGDITAKFLENATVMADGFVYTESILHCNVSSGIEVRVTGKKGFITGGHVQANNKVVVKNLGAEMGASTIVEVGVDPKIKAEFSKLQKEITEIVKAIRIAQPVVAGFMEKKAKGARITPEQTKYVMDTAKTIESKKVELETKNARMQELQTFFDVQSQAKVEVSGDVYPGTTIVIGDLSMPVQSKFSYCSFEVVRGDVKAVPL